MLKSKISSYAKIGYKSAIPEGADKDDFDTIIIQEKSGKNITLYREKTNRKNFDETTDFKKSRDVFNSLL